MTGQHQAKREVRRLIGSPDLVFDEQGAWEALAGLPAKAVLRALCSTLCCAGARERHRAAALLGRAVAEMAGEGGAGLEAGREIMRRLLWGLNEESGTMAWGAPEAMAEIMARHHGLAAEFARLLAAHVDPSLNPLDHPGLLGGAIWGLGRLATARPEAVRELDLAAALLPHLAAREPALRGLAAWAVGQARLGPARPALRGLLGDGAVASLPAPDGPRESTVGELARQALEAIASGPGGPTS